MDYNKLYKKWNLLLESWKPDQDMVVCAYGDKYLLHSPEDGGFLDLDENVYKYENIDLKELEPLPFEKVPEEFKPLLADYEVVYPFDFSKERYEFRIYDGNNYAHLFKYTGHAAIVRAHRPNQYIFNMYFRKNGPRHRDRPIEIVGILKMTHNWRTNKYEEPLTYIISNPSSGPGLYKGEVKFQDNGYLRLINIPSYYIEAEMFLNANLTPEHIEELKLVRK